MKQSKVKPTYLFEMRHYTKTNDEYWEGKEKKRPIYRHRSTDGQQGKKKVRDPQFTGFSMQNQCESCGGWYPQNLKACKHCGSANEDYVLRYFGIEYREEGRKEGRK